MKNIESEVVMIEGLVYVFFHLPANSLALTYGSAAQTLRSSFNHMDFSMRAQQ